jgi:tRNA-dihydrouridine synthase 3
VSPSPFADKLWLAPLTFGGNLPFRRLCVELGAEVTVSEMAVASRLVRGISSEFALLKGHAEEPFFGVQLAARKPEMLAEAGRIAEQRGARFVDLNCGCPVAEITRRGLGASLLRKPSRIGQLVAALAAAVGIPVTVKLRSGWDEGRPNASELARVCEESGASAITLHARTRNQRYSRAADWDLIGRVAAERGIPVVGNGDILTHFEARERMQRVGVSSVMVARGALIKPWLFREIHEDRGHFPSSEERLSLIWRLVELLREHFGDDERGCRRSRRFLAWHLDFFCRYRPLPEEQYAEQARQHPLLQTRLPAGNDTSALGRLLDDPRTEVHDRLSAELIGAQDCADGLLRARSLAEELEAARSEATPPDGSALD